MILRRLSTDHDMTFGHGLSNFIRDAAATAQAVKTRLLLIREEWFLDTSAGVPWLQEITVRPENLPLAEALIKQTIAETEGVERILSFSMQFDRQTRRLSVQTEVVSIYGSTATIRI